MIRTSPPLTLTIGTVGFRLVLVLVLTLEQIFLIMETREEETSCFLDVALEPQSGRSPPTNLETFIVLEEIEKRDEHERHSSLSGGMVQK